MSDFKPFYRVLVRDSDDTAWVPGFYSHVAGTADAPASWSESKYMPVCGESVAVRDSGMKFWVPRIAVGIDGDGRYLCRKLPCTNESDLCSWEHARAWDDELVAVVPIPDEPREPK
jgi:hypothetical protein